jgi:hypothetical protein
MPSEAKGTGPHCKLGSPNPASWFSRKEGLKFKSGSPSNSNVELRAGRSNNARSEVDMMLGGCLLTFSGCCAYCAIHLECG